MISAKLLAIWLIFISICKRILKYIALPFLAVWFVIKWVYVIIVAVIALIVALAASIIKGDWKV